MDHPDVELDALTGSRPLIDESGNKNIEVFRTICAASQAHSSLRSVAANFGVWITFWARADLCGTLVNWQAGRRSPALFGCPPDQLSGHSANLARLAG